MFISEYTFHRMKYVNKEIIEDKKKYKLCSNLGKWKEIRLQKFMKDRRKYVNKEMEDIMKHKVTKESRKIDGNTS